LHGYQGRSAFSGRSWVGTSWVGTRPYQIAKDRQGGAAARRAHPGPAKPTCRGASPRAPARGLL